ncbi:MAG TPA: hypothetical protein VFW50_05555 [Streptosporangiaceae bacterium]|nr:hypothetical protein [Streptosporangiaceae bacterium]
MATGSTETVGAGAAGGGAVATLLLGERPGGLGGPGASTGVDAPGGSTGSEWPGTAAGAAGPAQVAGPGGVAGPAGAAAGRPGTSAGADRARPAGWWQAWRARFGLAEVCGTGAAMAGFAAGYLQAGSLLAAAGLATLCEAIGFYGCIGAKTAAAAGRATAHLGGWRRLAAGSWHAVREQLASCAVAEAADGFLIRPGCMAGAAWLLRPLPAGVWLGFLAGKAVADVAWYGLEAYARRGVAWPARRG